MRRRGALPVAALALAAPLPFDGCGDGPGARATGAEPAMTLRQAIGQRFVFPFDGTEPPRALVERIRRGEAAGVILFGRNVRSVAQVRALTRRLQRIPRPRGLDAPLLVLVDQEGGLVKRLPGAPSRAAAQMTSAAVARREGRATGALLRRAGVNVDLAPVVDVGRPGSAIEDERRSFGRSAATVTARAGAFAAGLRTGGAEPVLKHYPGFGAARVNTDNARAEIDLSLAALRRVDLAPYRALRDKVRAVMVSTVVYPRVDPRPAAFARRWVTTELRGRLGFDGVTMADDLGGAAVRGFGSPAQLALFAIDAGIDMPLFGGDYATAASAASGLERAVRRKALTRAQLETGARRVLALRRALR